MDEFDQDVLNIDEHVEIVEDAVAPLSRGALLHRSTEKPAASLRKTLIRQPDPIPPNSTAINKTKARIALKPTLKKPVGVEPRRIKKPEVKSQATASVSHQQTHTVFNCMYTNTHAQ